MYISSVTLMQPRWLTLSRFRYYLFPIETRETWGLPLSEAKTYKKWIFAADLPYAHEVLYNYSKTRYFPFDDEKILVHTY